MISNARFYSVAIFLVLLLLVLTVFWGIDFPYMDQWEAVSLMEKLFTHTLSFKDFTAQHNEHRILFPKLIMVLGAWLTDWNIVLELFINILLGISLFLVISKPIKELFQQPIPHQLGLISIISLLIFSLSQYENWRWGWQIQIFLNVLMVALGIYWLAKSAVSNWYFIGAIIAGVVATYSFANGLLFWGVGFVVLWNLSLKNLQKQVYLVVWGILTITLAWSYIGGYHRPEEHPTPVLSFDYLFNYIAFVLAYLGNPLFESDANASFIFGIVGVLIYGYGWYRVYTQAIFDKTKYAVFFYWSLYTLMSAGLTALGRTGLGLPSASASRYVTICNFFWINNFILLFTLLHDSFGHTVRQKGYLKGLIWILGLVVLASHIVGGTMMYKYHNDMTEVRSQLLSGGQDSLILKKSYPRPHQVVERDKILEKYKLSYRGK
jgi:hypothetical protein